VAPVLLSCAVLPDIGTSVQLGADHAKMYREELNTLELLATVLDESRGSISEPTEEEL
jgi:hypothetical protein